MNLARRAVIRFAAAAPFVLLASHGAGAAESTLPPGEWSAIKRVIDDQLHALREGDGDRAFSFAAPAIRAQFGTADNFSRMVRTAYAPLLAARYSEFLAGAIIEGNVIQPLRIIAADNTVRVALYTMEKQPDGSWKITGCALAPSTVQAA